ncbi:pilus assembly protein N-terminal domain-containing protein [Alloacidobacterium dinghuense]|uniref:Pilus assembly protein N-terminal domain-containing protein n=1 Tax=Alloacidobacterium dinghuense TaxID=2763107 RepID=A0A7G8BK16_9BACT|nr:pilus assembly protein N-terminal domain-containing protein [Alloacidobacterium dinghuense]QNI32886.1 pilus assembly protein N-terminal domain-containing protein [Alloacidobacterium dinghuense]
MESASTDASNTLFVAVGKSVLVDTEKPITRVAVASGEVAEAAAVSPSEIMVNGKAFGETSLIIWEAGGGRQFFNVRVRAALEASSERLEGLRRELRTEFPGQPIQVSAEGGNIFLRGTVKNLASSDRAVQIASTVGKVVNLLYVDVPPPTQQILLKVRFASYDRTLNKSLGINLFSLGAANTIGSVTTQQFSAPSVTQGSGSTPASAALSDLLNIFVFRPDINLGATIKALQENNILQVLAEPNLLVENGRQGSFLAGGQFPYPTVQGATGAGGVGAVTIAFKEFGVRLNFIPTLTPRNTIRLQVAPEVSALDYANGLTISGFTVPGIDVRKVNTEVELGEGQSFVIGGLLDNRTTKNLQKIPFLGDVPILGKFFQSIATSKTNTELIVIVTPEIVAPIPANAPVPELKYGDKFLSPNSDIPMTNPGPQVTGAKPFAASPASMPVEKLVESMKPEQPLTIDGSMGSGSSTLAIPQNGASQQ